MSAKLISHEKDKLRKEISDKLKSISLIEKFDLDAKITKNFNNLPLIDSAKKVCVYYPVSFEINTKAIIQNLLDKKIEVYIPRVISKTKMTFCKIQSLEFEHEYFKSIMQPKTNKFEIEDPSMVDFFVVPGLAFDKKGNRLGHGLGYYDRYFSDKKIQTIKKVALCYEKQIINELPIDSFDKKVDFLVSERKAYKL